MIKIKVLAPSKKENDRDYGDCILINDNGSVVVYDCGSDELADLVLDYLRKNNISKVDVVLSHNDNDHFAGIPKLIESGVVNSVTTILLKDYVHEIKDRIEDERVTENSIQNKIEEWYSNIYSLDEKYLCDAITDKNITNNIKIVGPSKDYFLDAVAKQFDPTESDCIDQVTIFNAISIQLDIKIDKYRTLLTGDASFEAFSDKLYKYDCIQLPHHGNKDIAEKIFEENEKRNNIIYIVSDNKGDSINGGSDDLPSKGYDIRNSKKGSFVIDSSSFCSQIKGSLGFYEIFNIRQ